jgi:hypothetical protein
MSIWKQRREFMSNVDPKTVEYIVSIPMHVDNLQELIDYQRELEKRLKNTPYVPIIVKCSHYTEDNCNMWQTIEVCFPHLKNMAMLYLTDVEKRYEHAHLIIFKINESDEK